MTDFIQRAQSETCDKGKNWAEYLEQMRLNGPGGYKLERKKYLAVDEACRAIFRPTADSKESTFDSSGFSAEGRFISASAVPRHWGCSIHGGGGGGVVGGARGGR